MHTVTSTVRTLYRVHATVNFHNLRAAEILSKDRSVDSSRDQYDAQVLEWVHHVAQQHQQEVRLQHVETSSCDTNIYMYMYPEVT